MQYKALLRIRQTADRDATQHPANIRKCPVEAVYSSQKIHAFIKIPEETIRHTSVAPKTDSASFALAFGVASFTFTFGGVLLPA